MYILLTFFPSNPQHFCGFNCRWIIDFFLKQIEQLHTGFRSPHRRFLTNSLEFEHLSAFPVWFYTRVISILFPVSSSFFITFNPDFGPIWRRRYFIFLIVPCVFECFISRFVVTRITSLFSNSIFHLLRIWIRISQPAVFLACRSQRSVLPISTRHP